MAAQAVGPPRRQCPDVRYTSDPALETRSRQNRRPSLWRAVAPVRHLVRRRGRGARLCPPAEDLLLRRRRARRPCNRGRPRRPPLRPRLPAGLLRSQVCVPTAEAALRAPSLSVSAQEAEMITSITCLTDPGNSKESVRLCPECSDRLSMHRRGALQERYK